LAVCLIFRPEALAQLAFFQKHDDVNHRQAENRVGLHRHELAPKDENGWMKSQGINPGGMLISKINAA